MGRLRYHRGLLAAGLIAGTLLAQEPRFNISTKLVRLVVTVKDAKGEPVGNLARTDFSITDSGVPQTIRFFEHHTEVPLSVSLLIDTSLSTKKDFQYEIDSVRRFVRALLREGNPNDAIAVYSFAGDVTLQTSFTRREAVVRDALANLKNSSGTSLYDAVYLASRQLEDRDGRHVVIIVTDGGDTTSKENYQSSLRALQFAEAIVYPILVTPILGEPGRSLGGERVLAQFASNTGGRMFEPVGASQMDGHFTAILRDLRTQYLIGFRPENLPQDLPAFHPIRVEVGRPGLQTALQITTRSGYYEDGAKR
jgi:Ca-activated chloride channel family protein